MNKLYIVEYNFWYNDLSPYVDSIHTSLESANNRKGVLDKRILDCEHYDPHTADWVEVMAYAPHSHYFVKDNVVKETI